MKHLAKFIPSIILILALPLTSSASSSNSDEPSGEHHIPLKIYMPSKRPNKPGKPIIATYNESNHTLSIQISSSDVQPINITIESQESVEDLQYYTAPIIVHLAPNIVYHISAVIGGVTYEGKFIYM